MARGTLYIVGTPIGNLQDLSPRARDVLARSRVIACEDTRTTRGLMEAFGLRTPLLSHHRFNEARGAERFLAVLRDGGEVAMVCDGGTPALSDPGALLVRRAREEGHAVVPIPGPSAITTVLSVSGLPPGPFTFVGFLPSRRGGRRRALEGLRREERVLLFFEAPHRLPESLADMQEILGDRAAFLGREMTKRHEEFLSGPISAVRAAFKGRAVRGEITLLVEGAAAGEPAISAADTTPPEPPAAAVRRLLAAGWDRKEALRRVARERGLSRREVYRALLRDEGEPE